MKKLLNYIIILPSQLTKSAIALSVTCLLMLIALLAYASKRSQQLIFIFIFLGFIIYKLYNYYINGSKKSLIFSFSLLLLVGAYLFSIIFLLLYKLGLIYFDNLLYFLYSNQIFSVSL